MGDSHRVHWTPNGIEKLVLPACSYLQWQTNSLLHASYIAHFRLGGPDVDVLMDCFGHTVITWLHVFLQRIGCADLAGPFQSSVSGKTASIMSFFAIYC